MILASVVRDLLRARRTKGRARGDAAAPTARCVLNVGGNNKAIAIPGHYAGWNHLLLDIDPSGKPDIVCDARQLAALDGWEFDAVYCSHNLEHYYPHDGAAVLRGFLHVLKPDGFAEIRVPDLASVMRHVVASGLDIEDTLYHSPAGPIAVRDVIYGLGRQIERSGNEFFAHKTGFTAASLRAALARAGFAAIDVAERPELFELRAIAFRGEPAPWQMALLGAPGAAAT